MDLLYSRYSNPLNLIQIYINQGRFGEFVKGFLEEEYNRKNQEAEKERDLKLWIAYVHSFAEDNFENWKSRINPKGNNGRSGDEYLDDDGIQAIIDNLFPKS